MNTKFAELMSNPEFKKFYAIEGLLADASQMISDLLVERSLKKADLARMLGKTPAFVSQLLSGNSNMTLRTLAEAAYALDAKISISAESSNTREGSESFESRGCRTFKTSLSLRSPQITFKLKGSGELASGDMDAGLHHGRNEYVA